GQAMAAHGEALAGINVRGVDPELERTVSNIFTVTKRGDVAALTPGSFNVVIGQRLATALGVDLGDEIVLVLAEGRVTPAGMLPRVRSFKVAGIFDAGMY